MKIIKLIFVLLILLASQTNAQYGRQWQNPYPQPIDFNDFFFVDVNRGWVSGDYDLIIVTAYDDGITDATKSESFYPSEYFLSKNFPDPFNSSTNLLNKELSVANTSLTLMPQIYRVSLFFFY